jgi:hypothetical protein
MRRRTVVIGLVVLVIGVVLLAVGALGVLSNVTISRNFTQPHPGEYVSAEIMLNTTSGVAVSSPAAVGGLIPAQDLNLVNSGNIGTYAVPINATSLGTDTYRELVGDYYYVAFASTQPSTTIVATPRGSALVGFGALVLVGLACTVAGIIVAIVGAIQKPKPVGPAAPNP